MSFSVEGDVYSFSEVASMVRNLNASLSLLDYSVLDITQGMYVHAKPFAILLYIIVYSNYL